MQRLLLGIDHLSAWVGKIFSWCILILTFVVSYEVISRYAFGRPTSWAYDTSYILYGTLFIMAGAYTLSRNGHVRADFLYRMMRPRRQAGLDLALWLLFFFPGITAFMVSGWSYFELSWRMNEHSSFTPGGPPLYPFKALIPISGFFLFLQGVAETVRCIVCLRMGDWPQRLHDVEEIEKEILARGGADLRDEPRDDLSPSSPIGGSR